MKVCERKLNNDIASWRATRFLTLMLAAERIYPGDFERPANVANESRVSPNWQHAACPSLLVTEVPLRRDMS